MEAVGLLIEPFGIERLVFVGCYVLLAILGACLLLRGWEWLLVSGWGWLLASVVGKVFWLGLAIFGAGLVILAWEQM
jgi:hypothetical protein